MTYQFIPQLGLNMGDLIRAFAPGLFELRLVRMPGVHRGLGWG